MASATVLSFAMHYTLFQSKLFYFVDYNLGHCGRSCLQIRCKHYRQLAAILEGRKLIIINPWYGEH